MLASGKNALVDTLPYCLYKTKDASLCKRHLLPDLGLGHHEETYKNKFVVSDDLADTFHKIFLY